MRYQSCNIKVDCSCYGIKIKERMTKFANKIDKPKVNAYPNCGEISMNIDNVSKIKKINNKLTKK